MIGLVGSALAVKKISKILKIPENAAGQYTSLINKIKEVIQKEVETIKRFKTDTTLPQRVSASPVSKEQYFAAIFSEIQTGKSKYDDITVLESRKVAFNILVDEDVMNDIAQTAITDMYQTQQKDVGLLHKGVQLLEEKHFKTLLESEAHLDSTEGDNYTRLTEPWMKKIWEELPSFSNIRWVPLDALVPPIRQR